MLYERWLNTVQNHANEIALVDSQGRWTFRALAKAAEDPSETARAAAYPQGTGVSFVAEVLRAWRMRRVVCPLEPGQVAPNLAGVPSKCVHVKTTSASTGLSRLVA